MRQNPSLTGKYNAGANDDDINVMSALTDILSNTVTRLFL